MQIRLLVVEIFMLYVSVSRVVFFLYGQNFCGFRGRFCEVRKVFLVLLLLKFKSINEVIKEDECFLNAFFRIKCLRRYKRKGGEYFRMVRVKSIVVIWVLVYIFFILFLGFVGVIFLGVYLRGQVWFKRFRVQFKLEQSVR